MKTYTNVANLLKAGYSKAEVFEKLVSAEKDPKALAEVISQFPSSRAFRENQSLINQFYRYLFIYGLTLFNISISVFIFYAQWKLVVMISCGISLFAYIIYSSEKGVKVMMQVLFFMPFVFSTYYPIGIVTTFFKDPHFEMSLDNAFLMIFNALFVFYSAAFSVYAFQVIKRVFKNEFFFSRWEWNKETNIPIFYEDN